MIHTKQVSTPSMYHGIIALENSLSTVHFGAAADIKFALCSPVLARKSLMELMKQYRKTWI